MRQGRRGCRRPRRGATRWPPAARRHPSSIWPGGGDRERDDRAIRARGVALRIGAQVAQQLDPVDISHDCSSGRLVSFAISPASLSRRARSVSGEAASPVMAAVMCRRGGAGREPAGQAPAGFGRRQHSVEAAAQGRVPRRRRQGPQLGRAGTVDHHLLDPSPRRRRDEERRRAVGAGSGELRGDRALQGLREVEEARQLPRSRSSCRRRPAPRCAWRARPGVRCEVLEALGGQRQGDAQLAGLADVALDLGDDGGRSGRAVELVEGEALGRFARHVEALAVPVAIGSAGSRPPRPGRSTSAW